MILSTWGVYGPWGVPGLGGCLVWGVPGLGGVPGRGGVPGLKESAPGVGGDWWRPPLMATAEGGTHPTGMHSCDNFFSLKQDLCS